MLRHNLFYNKQSNRLVIFVFILWSRTKCGSCECHINHGGWTKQHSSCNQCNQNSVIIQSIPCNPLNANALSQLSNNKFMIRFSIVKWQWYIYLGNQFDLLDTKEYILLIADFIDLHWNCTGHWFLSLLIWICILYF